MNVNIGCGPHYAAGWVNVDRIHNPDLNIVPDIVNPTGRPLLLDIGNDVERIYLGHVLEHVPWDHVAGFLGECLALLKPGGQCLVVGPDVFRTLRMWKNGQVPDTLMHAVLEGADPQVDDIEARWDGARHQWNADQQRVAFQMRRAGFENVTEFPQVRDVPDGWPIVSRVEWQSAVIGVAP